MGADEVGIRGSLFKELKRYVSSQHSPETFKKILEKMDPGYRAVFEGVLVPGEYYDLKAYQQFLEVFSGEVSAEELEKSAVYLAEENLKGLFLVFARLLSKEYLIKRMSMMWEKIYTTGTVSLIETNDDRSGILVKDMEYNPAHRTHSEVYIRTILERATKQPHRSEARDVGPGKTEFWFYPQG